MIIKPSRYSDTSYDSIEYQKSVTRLRLAMYNCQHENHIASKIAATFSPETAAKLYNIIDLSVNLFKQVINTVTDLYTTPPSRSFYSNNAMSVDAVQGIYKRIDIDSFMRTVNLITNITNDSIIFVSVGNDNKTPVLEVFHCDNCDVKTSENNSRIVTEFSYMSGKNKVVWREDSWTDNLESGVWRENPYGVIPIVKISAAPFSASFWNSSYNLELVYAESKRALLSTDLIHTAIMSAFRSIYVKDGELVTGEPPAMDESFGDMKETSAAPVQMGPGAIITMNSKANGSSNGGEIGTLDAATDLSNQGDNIKNAMELVLSQFGINTDTTSNITATEIMVRRETLDKFRTEQIPLYRSFEQSLLNMILTVFNAHNGPEYIEPCTVELSFVKRMIFDNAKEEFSYYMDQFMNGILSPSEFMEKVTGKKMSDKDAADRISSNVSAYNNIYRQV